MVVGITGVDAAEREILFFEIVGCCRKSAPGVGERPSAAVWLWSGVVGLAVAGVWSIMRHT